MTVKRSEARQLAIQKYKSIMICSTDIRRRDKAAAHRGRVIFTVRMQ